MGALQALINERGDDARDVPVRPESLARLIALVQDGTVSDSAAKKVLGFMADGGRRSDGDHRGQRVAAGA